MHYKITTVDIELIADHELEEFLADKEFIGKQFKDEDDMDLFVGEFEKQYGVNVETLSYEICTTEEEDQAEWDATVSAAYEEAESTGRSFDHIMGEILAGIH